MERTIREKTINLAGRSITVRELTVDAVMRLIEQSDDDTGLFVELKQLLNSATGLALDDLRPFAFSELKTLYDTIKDVNKDFFEMARTIGLEEHLNKMWKNLLTLLSATVTASLDAAMSPAALVPGPGGGSSES